ncbi:hypothetical protein [Hydrogenophaga sp. 2FB]|uniref:hypothetical protein n=1 Tax=Hydrogenophaga sp. 2FB TaxID=2502187 RepID=UPI0010F64F7C|nr:hypothetical protein [Hydrogenophaga sp. 2FB]
MSHNPNRAERREDALIDMLPHVLIAVMLAVAALLLVTFMSLLDDMNERGEQRRLQQRTTGSLLLLDELGVPGVSDGRALSASADASPLR